MAKCDATPEHRIHHISIRCADYPDKVADELKGHDSDCAWEGYMSPAACGCLVAKLVGKFRK